MIGALLILFAGWRFMSSKALNDRLIQHAESNDIMALSRDATHTWWSSDTDMAARALYEMLVRKARDLKQPGTGSLTRAPRYLFWDQNHDSVHKVQSLLGEALTYKNDEGPLTLFLVGTVHTERVGTYTTSQSPGYRDRVEICLVQFDNIGDPGKALGCHEVEGDEPPSTRSQNNKEEVHGELNRPIADWVKSLPKKP